MSRDKETPRINSSLLHKNIGRTVNSQQAVLEASDKGQVNVLLAPGSIVRAGVIEILGRVESDMSVTELSSFMFNGDYDSESYDKMINIAASQPELFGGL
ncbi:hypothetical protein BSLG_001259 [Batrachochytrium salamandrivorans]|nr:hypothetical protein BSLG_001259 [Batrachochytrium salamandrivorans]